jgi:hypothetical protein
MTVLKYNKPVETRESTLQIDGLKAGTYRFQLRVFDDKGNVSQPDIVSVQVTARRIISIIPGLILPRNTNG